jgi:hypothetical protein
MAISIVQSGQTAGAANNSAITFGGAATAGNLLATFFSQSLTTTPSCSGFTVNTTKSVYNASADSCWVAYKIAAGGETTATWTAGAGGTGHGVCFWEIAGAANPFALDFTPPVSTDNINSTTAGLTVTTTVPGSIILIGLGGNVSSGVISAWSGTNVATNIGTAAARCFGGSFITTTPVSSTFTANWSTSRVSGMLGIAFQPPVASTFTPVPAVVMAPYIPAGARG